MFLQEERTILLTKPLTTEALSQGSTVKRLLEFLFLQTLIEKLEAGLHGDEAMHDGYFCTMKL